MAKKSMIAKANREPKYSTRAYTRCVRCGRPHSVYRKFGLCRICLQLVIAGFPDAGLPRSGVAATGDDEPIGSSHQRTIGGN